MTDIASRLASALAGRYRIERELGAGGMATVYLAEDLKHHRQVALKVLRPELAAAVGTTRFLKEIEVTARLQHPHVLPLFDSGEADGLLFYVMPYVDGESLRDRLNREGRLPVADALAIARDVAAALTFAHGRGVVHRDVKPENVLLEDGEALVADFGIALALAATQSTRLTATGMAIGTPAYMSPEQVTGQETIDGRSDVYALACVMFEMLTGEPPFVGPNPQAVAARSLTESPPAASAKRSELPPATDAALAKALAKDPADRFATPRELVEACAPSPAVGPKRRAVVIGALVAAVAIVALVWPLWRTMQRDRARTLLPRIAALAEDGRYLDAYDLVGQAERWIAADSGLAGLLESVSDLLTVTTEPAGADVYLQRVPAEGEPVPDSVRIGSTPIRGLRTARADYRVVIRKSGFEPIERIASSAFGRSQLGAASGRSVVLAVPLSPTDSLPDEMVAVPGGHYTIVNPDLPLGLETDLAAYQIDRFEVSNADYAAFLRSGGAPSGYLDRTGLPGPRGWVNQEPPAGKERHPVTGVSWHEAAAFCRAAGKRLPTLYEWEKTARDGQRARLGVMMPWGYVDAATSDDRRANFSSRGTAPVDSFPFGISPYGVYAMAGNVKEWLANPVGEGRGVTGGSWQDPAYVYTGVGSVEPDERSVTIGFRCARTVGDATSDQGAGPVEVDRPPPAYEPVDRAGFRALLTHYRYDRRPANPRGSTRLETPDWHRERTWIDGVGGDSILVYLYLPNRAEPPFQTLVYVPSTTAFFYEPVWRSAERELEPHLKAGRAVLAVVLSGMVERPSPPGFVPPPPSSVGFRDLMVLHATELRLGMDYLETREEIDRTKLAYIGLSLGAGSRLPFAAVDDRFASVILIGAGIDERLQPTLPEAANFNFAPYIRAPKLVVNGRNDEEHPWATRGLPLWNLLAEPKELVLVDGAGHHPPVEDRAASINDFLDRTLGPVRGGQ